MIKRILLFSALFFVFTELAKAQYCLADIFILAAQALISLIISQRQED